MIHGKNIVFGATAIMFLAAQPVWAESSQVTQVQLKPVNGGISVILKTSSGNRPQIFTTTRDKALVADIINTQLRLSQGNSFRQDNPAPGIASVAINQLDANSIRVVVTGTNSAPSNQPVERKQDGITLSFTQTGSVAGKMPTPQDNKPIPQNNQSAPQGNVLTSQRNQPAPQGNILTSQRNQSAPQPANPSQPRQKPDVLIPNPQITIDGKPAPAAGPVQPTTSGPPFLPRAVAPPVGDIAVSNLDASPSSIDLGTQERVPRLVLRDAPVREVLSLLARAASLNLAYVGGEGTPAAGGDGPTISLDIENEPVQDVFNYVLRLSGLEANRNGRTIFVGTKLPSSTRDTVMRNLRLNQVTVDAALSFLVGLGAESSVSRERQVTSVSAVAVGNTAAPVTQSQTTTELKIERLSLEDSKYSTPLLRGLQALGDSRTNSITLIGTSRLVDMAVAQITQLDVRRRQVAVNVKVIDVNLLATDNVSSSFSFGIGNNFFVNDGGTAALNFGGVNPPSAAQTTTSGGLTPPVINNVYQNAKPFIDPTNTTRGYIPLDQPLQPGITSAVDANRNEIVPVEIDPKTGQPTRYELKTTTTAPTFSLPSLFQFPKRFLSSLQAQVTNGNAKILTDPTLTVQEGQQALVNLTSEVYAGFKVVQSSTSQSLQSIFTREPIIRDAGLTVLVKVDRVDDNGFVSLSVAPTVSAPNGAVTTPDGDITLLTKRSLTSGVIRLRDGQTLILSGIIQDTDRVSVSKVPILGDIPILGSLFRKTGKSNERREVIVLLTPQIMDDSERSSYGYNYNPSPEVRQMLERRGLQVPKK